MKKKGKNEVIGEQCSNEQSYTVLKAGIKVYPVNVGSKMYIEADNRGEIVRFPKQVAQANINDALAKTIKFYYKKLTNGK